MKTIFTLLTLFVFSLSSSAQVLCIKCYNQNARVLTDTNNLIVNGGFENNTCIPENWFLSSYCPNSTYFNCNISGWICTGGGSKTYADIVDSNYSQVIEGTKAVYFGNNFCKACSATLDDTSCITNIGCEVIGTLAQFPNRDQGYGGDTGVSLQQTINGLAIGSIYMLEFWAGGENNQLFMGVFAVNVGFGNIFLKDKPTGYPSGIGIRYVIVFTATSSSHTIKFTNWGHTCGNCTELILDDVRLFAANPDGGNPCITSINDLPENTIASVFPNPATNLLTITTTSTQPSEITLFDIASRKLMEEKFRGTATLNIEGLAKGVYLYQVRDEKGVVSRGKVVKE